MDGLVVTHEHSDHVGGAAAYSRRAGVPIFTTAATLAAAGIERRDVCGLRAIEPGGSFTIGDLTVRPFSVPHDAADNIGLVVECEGKRLGYATDLGHASTLATERLQDCDVLVIEANHDEELLRSGPYPWSVKQRILSRHGHLSNEEMGGVVESAVSDRTRHILLAHLSETNNDPALASRICRRALERAGRGGVQVQVGEQRRVSKAVET